MTRPRCLLFYDGVCGLCNRSVQFILRHEKSPALTFATLQGHVAKQFGIPSTAEPESVVLVENGSIFTSSTAALRLVKYLRWYWQWMQLFWLFPRPIRNLVYTWIAANRYTWFGKFDSCPMPRPEVRHRFLDS